MTYQDKAFVTLLSSFDYLPSVLALKASMDKVNTKFPLVVLVTYNIQNNYIVNSLKQAGCIIEFIDSISYNQKVVEDNKGKNVLNTASKIKVFSLKQYDKLVYIDSDTMFLKNCDELFDYPDSSMMWDKNNNEPFSALFVFCPKYHDYFVYSVLQDRLCGFDGSLFIKAWQHIYDSPAHKIPSDYCEFVSMVNENTKVVHFCNIKKPWEAKHRDYFINVNKEIYLQYRSLLPKRYITVDDCVLDIKYDIPINQTNIGNTLDLFKIRKNQNHQVQSSVVLYHFTYPTIWERKENINNIFSFDGDKLHISEPVLNKNKIDVPLFMPPTSFAVISIINMKDVYISNEQLNEIVFDTMKELLPNAKFQRFGNDLYINDAKFIGVENDYFNNREVQVTASIITLSYKQYKEYFEAMGFTKPITGIGDEVDIGDFNEFKEKFRKTYERLLNRTE